MHVGVPEGSILGPLLFILFTNDINLSLHECESIIYADDTVLQTYGRTVEDIEEKLNVDMSCISTWCSRNKLCINSDKTTAMLITTRQKASTLTRRELVIQLRGDDIKVVSSMKILGVTFDESLDFNIHISNVASSMARNSALFKRIKCFLPFYVRKTFYFAYIQPIFDYCSVIWGPGRCIQNSQTSAEIY